MTRHRPDIAILGGGLAGGLIALALAERRRELGLLLVEGGESFGGNHLWSFFASDVDPQNRWLIERLIVQQWPDYEVTFPAYRRTLPTAYASITSARLDAELRQTLPSRALLPRSPVASCGPTHVVLANGTRIEAGAVIDARGLDLDGTLVGGWQKFVGQRLELERPHGLNRPTIMDATVAQCDGYRFVYTLPFGEREVFIEDTYYSTCSLLDRPMLRQRIADYAAARGWCPTRSLGEEAGVIPVVTGGRFAQVWRSGGDDLPKAGTRAGLFHPLTSYSLPDAVRFAAALCEQRDLSAAALAAFTRRYARQHWARGGFARRLGAMLFGAAAPAERYRVLQRFYGLPQPLIERFYAGRLSGADRLRILSGRPPVPVGQALRVLAGLGPAPTPLRHAPAAVPGA